MKLIGAVGGGLAALLTLGLGAAYLMQGGSSPPLPAAKKATAAGGAAPPSAAAPENVPVEQSPEVLALCEALDDGRGTLSDRLNPTHPAHDASFKARYQALSKKGRAVVVAADAARLQTAADAERWQVQMQRVAEFAKRQAAAAAARPPSSCAG